MNYTEKYHLPQWDENDRVMRTDFNDAMANLESGVAEAKSAADNAQAAAEEAAKLPYVVGSYYGTGNGTSITVNLGFRPRFVIIAHQGSDSNTTSSNLWTSGFATSNVSGITNLTDNGFRVDHRGNNFPYLNASGIRYDYIAFR